MLPSIPPLVVPTMLPSLLLPALLLCVRGEPRGPHGLEKRFTKRAPPTHPASTQPTEAPNQRRIEKEVLDSILGNKRFPCSSHPGQV